MSNVVELDEPIAIPKGEHYEIIDGERVELPPMAADSQVLASEISRHLSNFGISRNLGRASTEVLVKLPLSFDRNRRPDVIFVPFSRWRKNQAVPRTNAWEVLPSLCVEVVSPHDLFEDLTEKVAEYFEAGVEQVWIVNPVQKCIHVYTSPDEIHIVREGNALEGGSMLPGFHLPLAELFPGEDATVNA